MWPFTSWSSRALATSCESGPNRLVASEFIASIMPSVISPRMTLVAPRVRISMGPSEATAPRIEST
jgi:hypothetical protein